MTLTPIIRSGNRTKRSIQLNPMNTADDQTEAHDHQQNIETNINQYPIKKTTMTNQITNNNEHNDRHQIAKNIEQPTKQPKNLP